MTPRDDGRPVMCESPIGPATLLDYWLALLPPSEEDGVEEHLLACDACGEHLRGLIALSDALRVLARSGALRVVVGDAFITHAVDAGRRVRRYDLAPGETVPCTVSLDDELLVARFAADLAGAGRVDLSFCDGHGVERQRMRDIPVPTDARGVTLQESVEFAKTSPSTTLVARLLAVDTDGGERLLGEYVLQHTRTIPGPPGWEW